MHEIISPPSGTKAPAVKAAIGVDPHAVTDFVRSLQARIICPGVIGGFGCDDLQGLVRRINVAGGSSACRPAAARAVAVASRLRAVRIHCAAPGACAH